MNPLEALLRPFVALVNRQIKSTTPARELCANMTGKVIAIRVQNTALAMFFEIGADALNIASDYDDEPDVSLSGSLLSLASLATGEAAIRSGAVEIRGDAELAQSFRELLQFGRPDLEEELSAFIGDAPAHGVGDVARRIGAWSRDARDTMRQNISEYLQEESRTVPSRHEVEAFQRDVDALRDDVARLNARMQRIEALSARN